MAVVEAPMLATAAVEVVAPNLKRRLSGVTSTIVQLVPLQSERFSIATVGGGLPDSLPRLRWRQLPGLLRRPKARPVRIWHARRNIEMATGIVLRDLLRAPLRLVFTSAAQRDHRPFTKWLIRRMDAVIATSAGSGSFLHVPHTVIQHGVDQTRFRPPAPGESRGAADAGMPGRYLLGCFGRVRHSKGTDLFVDAMIALLPQFPEWSAVITGRATAEHRAFQAELERRIKDAGLGDRIRFFGEVPSVEPWYRRVHLYVAPSRQEGFGLTPLEAMASGAAVVASDAGAYREMIVAGETGAVVPAGDGAALREAIRPYLVDPAMASAHGLAGHALVSKRFPLQKEADAIGEVYERLFREAARA